VQYYFSFDVESVGLYGPPFAYGWCIVDETGQEYAHNIMWYRHPYLNLVDSAKLNTAASSDREYALTHHDTKWVREHVLPHLPKEGRAPEESDMLYQFWNDWIGCTRWYPSLTMVTDCPFPVETRFLHKVMEETIYCGRPDRLMERSPYPIIDVASVLLAHGKDPMATYERKPNEQPAHNPLCDARQSVRLMLEAMKL